MRFLWEHRVWFVVGCLITVGILVLINYAPVMPPWTGLPPTPVDAQGNALPQAKTLWDWLQLLLVPLILTVGGFIFTQRENRIAFEIQLREETEARRLEAQRTQEATVQAYIDKISELLLEKNLRGSEDGEDVRNVARMRTLTVLRVLDGVRKATVIEFLYENALIGQRILKPDNSIRLIDAVVILKGADLSQVNLPKANLAGANLVNANLIDANLEGANLEGANLERAILVEANLLQANLLRASLPEAYLDAADLRGAGLGGVDLRGTLFVGADLGGADLRGADLRGALFLGADLRGGDLRGADLRGTKLREAILRGANLRKVNLQGGNLQEADLQEVDLRESNITPEQLYQAASIEGAKFPPELVQLLLTTPVSKDAPIRS